MDPFEIIMTYGNTKHVDDDNEILTFKNLIVWMKLCL